MSNDWQQGQQPPPPPGGNPPPPPGGGAPPPPSGGEGYTPPPPAPPPPAPPTEPPAPQVAGGGSSSGLEPGLACVLAYLFSWLGGLIIFLIEKENKFVRFNAMQSILLGVAFIVASVALTIIGVILSAISGGLGCLVNILSPLLWLGYLILSIILMVRSYNGDKVVLPVIGPIAEQQS